MDKVFAPGVPKTEQGWYVFPDDVSHRKSLFPPIVMKHLAKFHLWLEEALIEYVSEPGGDRIITEELLSIMDKEIDFCDNQCEIQNKTE